MRKLVLIIASFSLAQGWPSARKPTQWHSGIADDIRWTPEQLELLKTRKVGDAVKFWSIEKPIEYTIESGITEPKHKEMIREAFKYWSDGTCLSFKEVTTPSSNNYIRINNGQGCNSFMGDLGSKPTDCTLNVPDCFTHATVVHELGHALGFNHEHQRSDRDPYVRIMDSSMTAGNEGSYSKETTTNLYEFDFYSVMIYGMWTGSSNGGPIVWADDPYHRDLLRLRNANPGGEEEKGSFLDKRTLIKAYKCENLINSACTGKRQCENDGYQDQSCFCVCKPGTEGNLCERKVRSYTDQMVKDKHPKSKKEVTEDTTVTSTFGKEFEFFSITVKKNRKCEKVFLKFDRFNLAGGQCGWHRLVITKNTKDIPETKDVYCDTALQGKNQEFKFEPNERLLISYERRGLLNFQYPDNMLKFNIIFDDKDCKTTGGNDDKDDPDC